MSIGVRRRIAIAACHALRLILPAHLRGWGRAILHEVADIDDDGQALAFALHSLRGLAPQAIAFHLVRPLARLSGDDTLSSGAMTMMRFHDEAMRRPRAIGIACAIGASGLGIAYMAIAGAPMRYLGINAGALVIGLMMLVAMGRGTVEVRRWPGAMTLAMSAILLAATLLGVTVDGAARWVRIGALFVQPSLILLPVMIVGFARARSPLSSAGMVVAALALAIQPDRAMAGMLAAGLAVLAVMRPDRRVLPALASAVAGFAVTLARADTLPAMPYVDQILYSAFDVHALAGLAVLGGSVLLIVPAIVGGFHDTDRREAYCVFGVVWLAAIVAAALGNYPTPLVGYSGSAVIGYVLSLTMLPGVAQTCPGATATILDANAEDARDRERLPYIGVVAYSAPA